MTSVRLSAFAVGAGILGVAAMDVLIFGGPLREWFKPQPILTFAGVIVGFLVLRWQLAIQHQNTVRVNAENKRNELHLEIYRDIAAQGEKTAREVQAFGSIGLRIDMAAALTSLPTPPVFPEAEELRKLWQTATAEVIALMGALEKWEIALGGGVANFKRALREGLDETSKAVDRIQPGLVLAKTRGAPPDLEAIRTAGQNLQATTLTISSYIWDLRIALQNRLLGGLFQYRVPVRQPAREGLNKSCQSRPPERQ
jgi:hypothetical protein